MLTMMKEKFLPAYYYEQLLYQQYQKCKQRNRIVAKHNSYQGLWMGVRTKINESENYQIARFVDGLRDDIQYQMDLQPINMLGEAIVMTTKAEQKLERKQKQVVWDNNSYNSYQNISAEP